MDRHRLSWARVAVAALILALVAAGCGSDPDRDASVAIDGAVGGTEATTDESGGGGDSVVPEPPMAESGRAEPAAIDASRSGALDADDAGAPVESTDVVEPPVGELGLQAGSVDDNESWEDYLLYRQEAETAGIDHLPLEIEGRRIISVRTPDGSPVLDAVVRIRDADGADVATLRTRADGRALFFPAVSDEDPIDQQQSGTADYLATVSRDGVDAELTLDRGLLAYDVVLDVAPVAAAVPVDVLFLLDATGSMADEIERLKANMISVAEDIAALPGQPDARFALTTYRDHAEEYLTRVVPFTANVEDFTDELRAVVADGGGDEPEALSEGLHAALGEVDWRDEATVRLIFLVADAPPHLNREGGPRYTDDLVAAAATGVKIFPVASSGANPQAELIFRQMAQYTAGRFVFLTYGADGISPGDQTSFNVDDYSVLALDELIVQLVADELDALVTTPTDGE